MHVWVYAVSPWSPYRISFRNYHFNFLSYSRSCGLLLVSRLARRRFSVFNILSSAAEARLWSVTWCWGLVIHWYCISGNYKNTFESKVRQMFRDGKSVMFKRGRCPKTFLVHIFNDSWIACLDDFFSFSGIRNQIPLEGADAFFPSDPLVSTPDRSRSQSQLQYWSSWQGAF